MVDERRFDNQDLQILQLLQDNARISNADIARHLGMAPSASLERLRKLEARGAVLGYEGRVDPEALGLELLAFIFVKANELPGESETGERLTEIPEVLEVHHIAGEDCYLVKVRSASPSALGRLLRERIGSIPTVASTRTTIVLESLKETGRLPFPEHQTAASAETSDD